MAAETHDREATVDEDGAVMIENHESVDVFLGVDVGKSAFKGVLPHRGCKRPRVMET